jgi:hypothetical protein
VLVLNKMVSIILVSVMRQDHNVCKQQISVKTRRETLHTLYQLGTLTMRRSACEAVAPECEEKEAQKLEA